MPATRVSPPPKPPIDHLKFINNYVLMIELVLPELIRLLEDELNPALLCYSKSLSEEERTSPTVEYLGYHILIPVSQGPMYMSLNGALQVSLHSKSIHFLSLDHKLGGKIKTMERETVYTTNFASVDVLFLEESFLSEAFDEFKPIQIADPLPENKTLEHNEHDYAPNYKTARQILEDEVRALNQHLTEEEQNAIFDTSLEQIDRLIVKFTLYFQNFLHIEQNVAHGSLELQCLKWARERLPTLQHQTLYSIISCASDYRELSIQKISHLYQPFEDYIFFSLHELLTDALSLQHNDEDKQFQKSCIKIRNDISLLPEGMPAYLRTVNLKTADLQLRKIASEEYATPIQKLVCLKETFSILDAIACEVTKSNVNSGSPLVERKKEPSSRSDLTGSGEIYVTEARRQYDHARDKRTNVMYLLLLLLLRHAPPNMKAHLLYIQFHTINDETYSALSMYYTAFEATYNQIISLNIQNGDVFSPNSIKSEKKQPIIRTYHTYIWGIVKDRIETVPTKVKGLEGAYPVAIQCGEKHVIVLTENQQVYTYGIGGEGQLGHGDQRDCFTFKEVSLLSTLDVIQVVGGGSHSGVVTRDGKLFCWGGNMWGQLGMGMTCECIPIPTQVSFSDVPMRVLKVACGAAHNLALLHDGSVWSWGHGANGRLGHGSEYNFTAPKQILEFPSNVHIENVCCGWGHSICITTDNKIFVFGKGSDGELGTGELSDQFEPVLVDFDFGTIYMVSSFYHTLVLSSKGLFSWGWGEHGQLGLGDTSSQPSPNLIDISPHSIAFISCGAFHSAAVSVEGVLLTWGEGSSGQLGHGDSNIQTSPYAVDYLTNQQMIEVSCGFSSTIAVQGESQLVEE